MVDFKPLKDQTFHRLMNCPRDEFDAGWKAALERWEGLTLDERRTEINLAVRVWEAP